jgi:hypothetical protein
MNLTECAMDHSKPPVMTYDMKKHGDLLFHRGVDVVFKHPSLPECMHWAGLFSSEALYIIGVVDVVHISNYLELSWLFSCKAVGSMLEWQQWVLLPHAEAQPGLPNQADLNMSFGLIDPKHFYL